MEVIVLMVGLWLASDTVSGQFGDEDGPLSPPTEEHRLTVAPGDLDPEFGTVVNMGRHRAGVAVARDGDEVIILDPAAARERFGAPAKIFPDGMPEPEPPVEVESAALVEERDAAVEQDETEVDAAALQPAEGAGEDPVAGEDGAQDADIDATPEEDAPEGDAAEGDGPVEDAEADAAEGSETESAAADTTEAETAEADGDGADEAAARAAAADWTFSQNEDRVAGPEAGP